MAKKARKTDREILDEIEDRRRILEDNLCSVVNGFTSALFVYGPPGLGKSHLLTTMLDGLCGRSWHHHTAHTTPKALFTALWESPDAIHLFEDCEQLIKTDLSASILRAACGAPNDRERRVTYRTAHENLAFDFRGGVIIATNQNLSRTNGPLQGVASRFRPILWDMTLEQRIATIRHLADRSHIKNGVELSKQECKLVAKRLLDMTADSQSGIQLDLRLFMEHALPAFAQAKEDPDVNWEDLLYAKITGTANTVAQTQTERTRELQQLAQKIDKEGGTSKEKLAKWKQLTGLGQAMFYRHLKSGKPDIHAKPKAPETPPVKLIDHQK